MSISNGYNSNSLLALEHSLSSLLSAQQRSPEVSDDESNVSQPSPSQPTEAQAFDWDEAIELDYLEDDAPEAEAMDWQDEEERSQNFGLEAEAETQEQEDPLSQSNSLFALEQSVFGAPPDSQPAEQFSVEPPQIPQIEAHAFDWDEAISLEYEGANSPAAQSFDWLPDEEPDHPIAQPFDWLPTDEGSESSGSENEPLTFTVEAFAVEDEEPPTYQTKASEAEAEPKTSPTNAIDTGSTAYGLDAKDRPSNSVTQPTETVTAHPLNTEDERSQAATPAADTPASYGLDATGLDATDESDEPVEAPAETSRAYEFDNDDEEIPLPNSQAYGNLKAIPVQATVVNPPSSSPQSADAIDFDALEQGMADDSQSSDTDTFAADIAAILRGEKIYEPAEPTPPTTAPPTQTQATRQSQAQSLPAQPPAAPKLPSAHDIFDQMGRSMSHATAFDLGTFSLEQTFDEFDRLLDEQHSEPLSHSAAYLPEAELEETKRSGETTQSISLDEAELAADVAALSANEPYQPAVQFELEKNDINSLLEEEISDSPHSAQYTALNLDETTSPAGEKIAAQSFGQPNPPPEEDQSYPPELEMAELEMEHLLSGSLEYSAAFVVTAAQSTLPTRQELTDRYTNHKGLLTAAEVTEIQRLSTGGTAAGPTGTKALTDRGLMDYQAMEAYARGTKFSNWETLPKPVRLQVATYQWTHHNPGAGMDMSNKPGYWKARSVDAHSEPSSPTADQSRQAIYDRDRTIWEYTLSEPTAGAIANLPAADQASRPTQDTAVRQILQRVFALLHLGLQCRIGTPPTYQPWSTYVAVALSHGGRVNVKIPQDTGDDILDWLFVNQATKTQAQVSTRLS